jgi:hypothetical protein
MSCVGRQIEKTRKYQSFGSRWRALCLTAIVLMSCASAADAANWYVRPDGTAYGTGSGTSWTNAFSGFSAIAWASVSPGDTIWVAGGTHRQSLVPGKSGTSASPIAIRRARADAAACTGAAGWSAAFDATIHQIQANIVFRTFNYIIVSGRTSAAGGTYGWWIDLRGETGGRGLDFPNGATASHLLVEYMRLQGPGNVTYTVDGRGVDDTPFSSATNHTFSHMAIHGWESGAYVAGVSNVTFEYIDMYDMMAQNWSWYHPNGIYTSAAPRGIVRYSRFHRGPDGNGVGEGIFFEQNGGSVDWQIYGNVFYDLNKTGWKSIEISSDVGAIKIFNNTFDDTGVPGVFINAGSCGTGAEVRNNLGYLTSFSTCGTMSNNLLVSSTAVWTNRAARDYHIVGTIGLGYPRNAGVALTRNGFIDEDADGITRAADGGWDLGAYEYSNCGGCQSGPGAPTNVRIMR